MKVILTEENDFFIFVLNSYKHIKFLCSLKFLYSHKSYHIDRKTEENYP